MAITIKPDIGKILEEIRKGLTDFGAWVTARNDLKDKTEFAKYVARVKFFITKCEQIFDSLKANENKLSEEDKVKTNKIYDEITLKWEELQGIIALNDQLHWPTARATAVSFARYLKGRKVVSFFAKLLVDNNCLVLLAKTNRLLRRTQEIKNKDLIGTCCVR